MEFMTRFFGRKQAAAAAPSSTHTHSQVSSGLSQQPPASQGSMRRELLRVVLRDTLHRQGIPPEWIGAELLNITSRDGKRGVHWRLLVKHWNPALLEHGVALQQALIKRLMTFDPVASTWLQGISWQFALEDESVCPPLPERGTWLTEEPDALDSAKANLEELLALRDAGFAQHAAANQGWAATQPSAIS